MNLGGGVGMAKKYREMIDADRRKATMRFVQDVAAILQGLKATIDSESSVDYIKVALGNDLWEYQHSLERGGPAPDPELISSYFEQAIGDVNRESVERQKRAH